MLGVVEVMQCPTADKKKGGEEYNNNGGKSGTMSMRSPDARTSKELQSSNHVSYGLTAQTQDNGYACKNNIGSGILVGKETTEAKQLRDNKMACNERDVTKTESDFCSAEKVIQIEKVNDSSSSKNCEGIVCEADATVQQQSQTNNSFKTEEERCKIQVDEQVTSSCSSDEEIFSRKAKQKKVVLLDDDIFDDEMDDVPFQTEAADDSNNDTKTTKSDLGQHDDDKDKITGSIDSKINHDICDDLFDAEMDEDDGGNGKSKENSGIEEADIDNENYVQNAVNDSERGSGHGDNIDDTCNATDNDMFGQGSEDGLGRTKRKKHQDKKEKPRRMKKADVKQIHSESQRILRESTARLPYHMPTVKPITHFLARVPRVPVSKNNSRKGAIYKKEDSTVTSDEHKTICSQSSSTSVNETSTPRGSAGKYKLRDLTPTLSMGADFVDLTDKTPPAPKPLNKGLKKLMERFAKHSSPKLQSKMEKVEPVKERQMIGKDSHADEKNKISPNRHKRIEPLVLEENTKELNTPGARLQVLREQLQQKMKLQRAEHRKIQESQRRLDNEELSEEEEAELTDEEDSDYELDRWNVDDEKKQEDGESEHGKNENNEGENGNEKFNFFEEIGSGSEGDVSDFEDGDSVDKESVFSDIETNFRKKEYLRDGQVTNGSTSMGLHRQVQYLHTLDRHSQDTTNCVHVDDRTMDLFGSDSRSRTDTQDSLVNVTNQNHKFEKSSDGNTENLGSYCLRLGSLQDENENAFSSYSNRNSNTTYTKVKETRKTDDYKLPISLSEASQESSIDRRLSSDFEASNDSSRIPAGQGEGTKTTFRFESGRNTPELFTSSLSRLQCLLNGCGPSNQDVGQTSPTKSTGKLSQLTLPVEDSQDLFYNEENGTEGDSHSKYASASESTNDNFRFTLDEDTQFTQLLNTQGFLNSSRKKKKSKAKKQFEHSELHLNDPMEELLGLCSGKFTEIANTELSEKDEEEEEDWKVEEEKVDREEQNEMENADEETGSVDSESGEELDCEERLQKTFGKTCEQLKKKLFEKRNFLEEEAELSGSDVGSDDENDDGDSNDEYEEEENDELLPSNNELQKQINKVHMKSMLDEDKAELRLYKEMYLPDGDLYTDGGGRTRNFRWRGIDDSQLDLFDNKGLWGEEDGFNLEEASENEIKKRKERFERDTFLREEMNKKKNEDIMDIDESSQTILSKIKNTSCPKPAVVEASAKKLVPTPMSTRPPKLVRLPSQKGSFLNRSKQTLSKLSAITANTTSASSATRAFVFQSVSPADKSKDHGKKLRRSASMLETPCAKRPKLESGTSHTPSGSVFSML